MISNPIQNIVNFGALILVMALSGRELFKAVEILFKNKSHLLFAAQVSLLFLRVLPSKMQDRRDEIMFYYEKRKRIYAVFTLIGSLYMIVVSLVWLLLALK